MKKEAMFVLVLLLANTILLGIATGNATGLIAYFYFIVTLINILLVFGLMLYVGADNETI